MHRQGEQARVNHDPAFSVWDRHRRSASATPP